MRDGRVREHPLHVPLRDRGEVPDREGSDRQDRNRDRPDLRLLGNAVTRIRSVTTSAATFVAPAMNAVTDVGAPW